MYSVLIPAYNEATCIVNTIIQMKTVMDQTGYVYEIIVIDDGSSDETVQLAQTTEARVICHPINSGYGRALKTGIRQAMYDWCIIVDADNTYPLNQIPGLLVYVPRFDMVVGSRTGKHYWGSPMKKFGRSLLRMMARFVTGTDIPDINSGMRVFRKDIALSHFNRISSGFSFTTTLTLAMLLDARFVKYVQIDYYPRVGESKVKYGKDTLRMLQILSQAVLYYNPLKLFLILCILTVLIGLIMAAIIALVGSISNAMLCFGIFLAASMLMGGIGFLVDALHLYRIDQNRKT